MKMAPMMTALILGFGFSGLAQTSVLSNSETNRILRAYNKTWRKSFGQIKVSNVEIENMNFKTLYCDQSSGCMMAYIVEYRLKGVLNSANEICNLMQFTSREQVLSENGLTSEFDEAIADCVIHNEPFEFQTPR